jgi:excisionase family DNA binding protein
MKDLACTSGISPNINELIQHCSGRAVLNSSLSVFEKCSRSIHFQTVNNYYINSTSSLFENLTWMNTQEAANYLRITVNSLRIKVSRGEVKPCHLGKSLRFKRTELDKLMEASKQRSP